jgi:hypothetical protein
LVGSRSIDDFPQLGGALTLQGCLSPHLFRCTGDLLGIGSTGLSNFAHLLDRCSDVFDALGLLFSGHGNFRD